MEEDKNIQLIKQLRTNQKISITKKINKINKLISLDTSSKQIEEELEKLNQRFSEAVKLNDEFREADQNKDVDDNWIMDLKVSLEECASMATNHINSAITSETEVKPKHNEDMDRVINLASKRLDNIMERIKIINDLIQSDSSVAKIKSLHERLLEIFRRNEKPSHRFHNRNNTVP